jgi:fatty-acyl-CoA synthase
MLTEDQGIMDENGYLRIVGRSKDMIIRGGENIYPSEIEEFLSTHPDIEEIHVFGVNDEFYGEKVAAWIKAKSTRKALSGKDIEEFCKGKIAHFKIPKIIKFVESFPTTVTGKVMKYKMREEYAEDK